MDYQKIADLLILKRGEKSQEEVANAVGVSVPAIRNYEQGERIPRDEIKYRLSKFFNTTVQELFFRDEFFE